MNELVAEFIGTAILLLLGNGVVANVVLTGTKGHNSGWIVITTAWAMAVFVAVVVAAPYSGAHLNPAVTLGLAIAKKFAWAKVPLFMAAQLAGAMVGTTLAWLFYKDHFKLTEDVGTKRAAFCTEPAVRNTPLNFFCEALATFVLVFVIFYFTDAEFSQGKIVIGLGSLGAARVAFLVWVIGLALGGTTGYATNPARDLGPRIMHALLPVHKKGGSDWGYAWIPVIGPLTGGAVAALLFLWLKI